MSIEKDLTKLIPRIYKWNAENLGLFFFIKGQTQIFPTMTIETSVMNYFRFISISVDEWDVQSAMTTYNRLQNEFYSCMKNETAQKDK
jgi:uncharacterized protein